MTTTATDDPTRDPSVNGIIGVVRAVILEDIVDTGRRLDELSDLELDVLRDIAIRLSAAVRDEAKRRRGWPIDRPSWD